MDFACNQPVTDSDLHKMDLLADPWKPKKQSIHCFFWRSAAAYPGCGPARRPGFV